MGIHCSVSTATDREFVATAVNIGRQNTSADARNAFRTADEEVRVVRRELRQKIVGLSVGVLALNDGELAGYAWALERRVEGRKDTTELELGGFGVLRKHYGKGVALFMAAELLERFDSRQKIYEPNTIIPPLLTHAYDTPLNGDRRHVLPVGSIQLVPTVGNLAIAVEDLLSQTYNKKIDDAELPIPTQPQPEVLTLT